MAMSKKNERKKRTDWKRAIQNNAFMVKLLYRASPGYVLFGLLETVFNVANSFLLNTYLYMYAINALQRREKLSTVLITVGCILVFSLICILTKKWYWDYYTVLLTPRIEQRIRRMLQDKAVAVELACFERPSFYDTYIKAIEETVSRAYNVYWTLMDFVWVILNIAAIGALIVSIDPIFILIALVPFTYTMLLGKRANRIKHDRDMRMKELNRKNAYVERTFYLSDYAKEMRVTKMPKVLMRQMRETVDEMKKVISTYGYSLLWFYYGTSLVFQVVVYVGAVLLASVRYSPLRQRRFAEAIKCP